MLLCNAHKQKVFEDDEKICLNSLKHILFKSHFLASGGPAQTSPDECNYCGLRILTVDLSSWGRSGGGWRLGGRSGGGGGRSDAVLANICITFCCLRLLLLTKINSEIYTSDTLNDMLRFISLIY